MAARRSIWAAAALVAAVVAASPAPGLAQPKAPAADPVVAAATQHFFAGQKLYAEKKFEGALGEFRASYAGAPSPNNRLYIARCLRELGRNAAAFDEYAQVIIDAADKSTSDAKYAGTQKAAAEERGALRGKVAALVVTMPADVAGVSMHIGSEEIPPGRWHQDLTVDVGRVTVRAEAPGRKPFEQQLTLVGGDKRQVIVELPVISTTSAPKADDKVEKPVAPSTGAPLRPLAFVSAGVGVAGFAMWGIFGLIAASKFDELSQKCNGRCGAAMQEDVDSGRTQTTISNIGLAVGIVGVVGGITLFVADVATRGPASSGGGGGGGGGGNARAPSSLAVRVSPDPTSPGVTVVGRF